MSKTMLGVLPNVWGLLTLSFVVEAQSDCASVADRVMDARGITYGRDHLRGLLCQNPEAVRLEAEFQAIRRDFVGQLNSQNELLRWQERAQDLVLAQHHDLRRDLAQFENCREDSARLVRCIANLRELRLHAAEYITDVERELAAVEERTTEENREAMGRVRGVLIRHLRIVEAHRSNLQGGAGD